jgi:acyl dehydratase
VHGEHEVLLHRPLIPGETLDTFSGPFAVRNTRAGARVVLHMEQYGADGGLAVEHWWTIFFPGCDELADVGPEPPDHTVPETARDQLVGSVTQHVDADAATRYAEVSNDWSAHHFDLDSARKAGVDHLFAHGLCTMAMCTQAAVAMIAEGDPSRVRRVAVRFASPTRLDADLTVDVYDASTGQADGSGAGVYAFEATAADAAVIKHGRIELFS